MARRNKPETPQDRVFKEAYKQLELLGGKTFHDDDIVFKGDQLIIPEHMNLEELEKFVSKKRQEWEADAEFVRQYQYKPWDVAYCSYNALKRAFGTVAHTHRIEMGFFGPQKAPPQMITISIDAHQTVQVPWGVLELPFLPKVTFSLDSGGNRRTGPIGMITATGPKKHQFAVEGVFNLIQLELEANSLYRGKAFDGQQIPQFLDLSLVDPDKIVYADATMRKLEASVWTPIRYPEVCQELGMPFKRAVLLAGDFGVGKSLAINRTGQICEENKTTFVLVRPGRDNLQEAMQTARMYQPAVVAFEDVDTIADSDEDREQMSQILDLFDGIEAKNSKVMLILSSNHPEKLHAGMLRPGRLDDVIPIGAPDKEGIRKLVMVNAPQKHLADPDTIDWSLTAKAMDGYLPAFIVEATQRSLRYIVSRTGGKLNGHQITTDDLCDAADDLRPQFEMMQAAKTEPTPNLLEERFKEIVDESVTDLLERHGVEVVQ